MRWRGVPLMKNVFDFAMYPMLIAELRPRTVFEIGSGLGASAAWFADHLAMNGVDGRVHSVDRVRVEAEYPHVNFYQGDCSTPQTLFEAELLRSEPHPWLVVEDAHHNVAAVIAHIAPVSDARRLSRGRGQRRQARGASRIPRRPSRRLPRRHAIYRQFRPQCDLRRRLDIRQDGQRTSAISGNSKTSRSETLRQTTQRSTPEPPRRTGWLAFAQGREEAVIPKPAREN